MSTAWDVFQHFQIAEVREEAQLAGAKAEGHGNRIDDLDAKVARLALACQAMWELMRDCSDLNEDHLKAKILEIDARDGRVDGKMGSEVIDCPHCGQKTGTNRGRCVFCGETVEGSHSFDR